jgi:hypothetical protein
LVDFIENDLNLEEKLEEFEGAFERDKFWIIFFPNFHVF